MPWINQSVSPNAYAENAPGDARPGWVEVAEGDPVIAVVMASAEVPQEVTSYQAKAALSLSPSTMGNASLLVDVENTVTAAGGLVLLAWQNATTFDRRGAFVLQMASKMGMSDGELDNLFTQAATITA